MDSRWPIKEKTGIYSRSHCERIERESGGMTRQDLRDAARLHIGDRGLMDHVLKEMNNVIVGSEGGCASHSEPSHSNFGIFHP